MKTTVLVSVVVGCLLCLSAGVVWADMAWEEQVTMKIAQEEGPPAQEKDSSAIWIKGQMMRIETEDTIVIYRLDKKLSWHIDKENNTLVEVSFERMRELLYDNYERMRQMTTRITGKEREQLIRDMNDLFPSGNPEDAIGFDIKRLSKREMVMDMDCLVMQLSAGTHFSALIWLADKAQLPQDFYDFFYGLREALEGLPKQRTMTALAEAVIQSKGFPMRQMVKDVTTLGESVAVYEIAKVNRGVLDPSLFEKPEDAVELTGLESEAQVQEVVAGKGRSGKW